MRGRARTDWFGVCLEAPDPHALTDFYAAVLGRAGPRVRATS